MSVRAIERVVAPWPFEVVVVVDGSTDGTADALRALDVPFSLAVESQPNSGQAAARNRGASIARGDIVLFLDDDMEPDPQILVAHERAHRAGADAVVGHIPLHPDSPQSIMRAGVEAWAEKRGARLRVHDGPLELSDLLTGQLSIRRDLFGELGRFDVQFTAGGSFGGEDIDFLHRAQVAGVKVVFAPDAISRQRYVVTPAQYLHQWHDAGRSDAALTAKHPELADELRRAHRFDRRLTRVVLWPLAGHPRVARPIRWVLRHVALAAARRPPWGLRRTTLFFRVRDLEYWAGARSQG
jgi:glycosyltransferase involved in cell wall biosynthesis